jgi:predicted dehydrogenase
MTKTLNIGIVGTQFMGRAHSNAYRQVRPFFEQPMEPVLRAACGQNPDRLQAFAGQFGWETTETDWQRLIDRDDVDLIDISTPNDSHEPIAVAGAKAGKHLLCEKPMARNVPEARRMYEAAATAGVVHMMIFNYRFVPAIRLARQLIEAGKLGLIRHINAVYYQDWLVDPLFPITWRHDAAASGSGAHGDMNAHIVDLARYLVGEFEAVCGAQDTFVKERPLAGGGGTGPVTTDDTTAFMARFQSGAVGLFQGTRYATGRKNFLRLEIFGSEGSVVFNLERLNELEYYSCADEATVQGFRTVLVTEKTHPFLAAWWPPGHILGWEHTFVHQVHTLLCGVATGQSPAPDFLDGLRCQEVLDAVQNSAKCGAWETIKDSLQ